MTVKQTEHHGNGDLPSLMGPNFQQLLHKYKVCQGITCAVNAGRDIYAVVGKRFTLATGAQTGVETE